MIKRTLLLAAAAALLAVPASAEAAPFGIMPGSLAVTATDSGGTIDTQASSHPGALSVHFKLNVDETGHSEGGQMRNAIVDLPPGLVGNPQAVPTCSRQDFERAGLLPECPGDTQVGFLRAIGPGLGEAIGPVYNITPPPGVAAQLGFASAELTSLQQGSVRTEEGYGLRVAAINTPLEVTEITETVWGVPAEAEHDAERTCLTSEGLAFEGCSSTAPKRAFLTMPASCGAAPETTVSVDSVQNPGAYVSATATALNAAKQPQPMSGCGAVPFSPEISSQPTSRLTTNPSGLDFTLKLANQGLTNPGGIAETEPRKVEVALPQGVTVNPSFAEGIATCSQAQYGAEQIDTAPGAGCPEGSKLGSVVVHSPLLEEAVEGSLYLAAPYENKFGTLAALYIVARAPERGVLVKQAGKIEFDPSTGQITSTFEDLPPLPFSDFTLHFREGARAPLVTPPGCGEYKTAAKLTPFSSSEAVTRTAAFQTERGPEGGACPSGGTPPFHPGLLAGSIAAGAGQFSPFYVDLTRSDSEQEITHFSIKLPPGITGKLAGIPFCGEAAIAAAKAREGTQHGGQEELEHPSCPAASQVGHTLVGAGVGQVLAYVPGEVYLAGPYNGSQLSIVAITAAKAGPFDLGTVVVREALRINPETAEVFVDATGSDPLPHILAGVPVHLRDVQVNVDRPDFTLNPTSCKLTSTASTLLGSGTNFVSEADDQPVTVASPFQAVNCAKLAFKPRLSLKLKGSTKRGGSPALTATLKPRPGDANVESASVALPHSEFLDQAHIGTICTRVQFKEAGGNGEKCPAASIYGHARAWTPLLSEPLEGPILLRSSEHPLPDLVVSLHGLVDFHSVGRIDSVKGGIRNSFEFVPDAPLSKVVLSFGGGKKSLLENSTNLCVGSHKATVKYAAHNGRAYEVKAPLQATCPKGKKGKHKKGHHKKPSRNRPAALRWLPGGAW